MDTNFFEEKQNPVLSSFLESSLSLKTLSASASSLDIASQIANEAESSKDKKIDEIINQPITDTQIETVTINETENFVEINSDRSISPEDLDAVLILFENEEASGGCDILEHELSQSRCKLILKYKSETAKKRVLEKQYISYKKYRFQVTEPFEINNAQKDSRTIVLANLPPDQDISLIQMLAENLSSQNSVEKIVKSSVFANTFYVTYKNEVDLDRVQSRLARRPKLQNQSIVVYQAHTTYTIILKPKNKRDIKTLLDIKFKFKSIRSCDSFYLVQFSSEESLNSSVDLIEKLNRSFTLENVYSFDLLEKAKIQSTSIVAVNWNMVFLVGIMIATVLTSFQIFPHLKRPSKDRGQDDLFK